MEILTLLSQKFNELLEKNGIEMSEEIYLEPLGIREAIGDPTPFRDFPLLKGKEKLLQADFRGAKGQAFTSFPSRWHGTLGEIIAMEQDGGKNSAIFVATVNAVSRYLGLCDGTIHCKNEEPERCAGKISEYVREHHPSERICIVGYQPAITNAISNTFDSSNIRIVDLDPENFGKVVCNSITIQNGEEELEEAAFGTDVALATGSSLANGSLNSILQAFDKKGKPVYFYGTTIAGAAEILGLRRLCFEAK